MAEFSNGLLTEDPFKTQEKVMVAAIDFGTTFSGYAYAFLSQPDKITLNKNWSSSTGFDSLKTTTSVLINTDGEFKSFGYKAEEQYAKYCTKGQEEKYRLFRNFKMLLYNIKNFSRTTMIQSICGKEYSAMVIFTLAIRYLKDHLLKAVGLAKNGVDTNKIQWVLTIPAIWTDRAKQFMREAAFNAGLMSSKVSKQLLFALEPEVASLLCRQMDVNGFANSSDIKSKICSQPGTKYLVVDAGGGTVDITAHQIQDDGNMVELMCATGGNWGGNQIDRKFEYYLENHILGHKIVDFLKSECPSEWLGMMLNFERKKKVIDKGDIQIPIHSYLSDKCKEVCGIPIEKVISDAKKTNVTYKEGDIIVQQQLVLQFFNQTIDQIIVKVKEIIKSNNMSGLNYILLVGGFGDSKILFEKMEKEFRRVCPVLCPSSAVSSVVKGAVIYGVKPHKITARVARKTYGRRVTLPFDERKHNSSKMFINEEGEKRCRGLFGVYVRKGEKVEVGSCKSFVTQPWISSLTEYTLPIYSTDNPDPIYIDESGVTKVGELNVKIPLLPAMSRKEKKQRTIEHRVYFGETEIRVEVEDKSRKDGEVVSTSINFLVN